MSLGHGEIADLIPHAGCMCLLERVLDWDDDSIRCEAVSHRAPDNPLRRDDRLHAVHLAEYAAQAMAVHGGLLARRQGARLAPGYLAALRGLKLHREHIDDLAGALRIEARQLAAIGGNLMYEFHIEHAGERLAEGRVTVAAAAPTPDGAAA